MFAFGLCSKGKNHKTNTKNWQETRFIICLAPWAGEINQILRCDWPSERTRWSYLSRSGLPVVSHKKTFPKRPIRNPLLIQSSWLVIGIILDLRVFGHQLPLGGNTSKKNWPRSRHLDIKLSQWPICFSL